MPLYWFFNILKVYLTSLGDKLFLRIEFRTLLARGFPGLFEKMNNPDVCCVTC